MAAIMALDESNEGADIRGERIGDLRFAYDIALLAQQEKGLQRTSREESSDGTMTKIEIEYKKYTLKVSN